MKPEEAVDAARAAAAERPEGEAEQLPGLRVHGTDRVSIEQLLEYAVIDPDIELTRSTRKLGKPITWTKRMLLHVLRQYTRELHMQQTRFNFHTTLRLAELEERIARIERGEDLADPESPPPPAVL